MSDDFTNEVRSMPCEACPYRQDVPSGLWVFEEYEKLREYDAPTGAQPFAGFACHATPDHFCHGWAVVHTSRGNQFDLLALRLVGRPPIPPPGVPLFASGNEAADHGQRDVDNMGDRATEVAERLVRKHPRLQTRDEQ